MFKHSRGKHMNDYLAILNRRRLLVACVWGVVVTLTLVTTLLTPKQYLGSSKILIERAAPSDLVKANRYALRDPAFLDTQIQVIRSHVVAERVVEQLQRVPEAESLFAEFTRQHSESLVQKILGGLVDSSSAEEGADTQQGAETSRQKLVAGISKAVTVRALQDSNVLSINYFSPDPQLAALVANAVADGYVTETQNMRVTAVRQGLERMTEKARQEGGRLAEAEKELYSYMLAHDLLGQENRNAMNSEELSEISSALIRAELQSKELEVLVRKVKRLKRKGEDLEALSVVSSNPTLQVIQTQILTSEKNIMELSGKYGPKHPVMVKAVNDVKLLRTRKESEIGRIVKALYNEYDLALRNVQTLEQKLGDARSKVLDVNEKYVEYESLLREVETNQKLHAALLMQMKEQDVTAEDQAVNVWLVEEAKVPQYPARPMVKLNLIMGLLVGLLAGVGAAWLREYFDQSLVTPDDVEQVLDLPVVGVIPEGKGNSICAEKTLLEEMFTVRADSYKSLRTSVNMAGNGTAPNTILVTSPSSGDGKTVIALNLAYAMAQVGLRVLLIDADMRRPSLHEALDLENHVGLSTYLIRESGLQAPGHIPRINGDGSLQRGPLEMLTVMTSGPVPPNPSELLSNGHLDKLLEILVKRFDRVIFDSPPLISVPDTRVMCRYFDGTVMVVRSNQTSAEMASRAARILKDARGNVIGTVLNGFNPRAASAYYDNYYPSRYRQEPMTGAVKNT